MYAVNCTVYRVRSMVYAPMYTVRSKRYTIQCTMYNVHTKIHSIDSTLPARVLYPMDSPQTGDPRIPAVVGSPQCTVYIMHCTLYTTFLPQDPCSSGVTSVENVYYVLHTVHYIVTPRNPAVVGSPQCTVYIMHCTLYTTFRPPGSLQ